MAPLRSSRHTRNQEHNQPIRNRAGVIDWDPTDGLPVRKWEQVAVKINQDVTADPSESNNQNQENADNGDFPWPEQPLPHFFSQLPQHSQELLRRARLGNANVKPPVWDRKTESWISSTEIDARNARLKSKNISNNPDSPSSDHDEDPDDENHDDLFDTEGVAPEKRRKTNSGLQERIFEAKKWIQVPTAIAEKSSEPKYLADRRPGMESLYGGAYKATHGFGSLGLNPGIGSGAAGFDLGDGAGLGNASGVLGANPAPEPAPVRKNMPPRRKKKKLGGPGRRKAVPVATGENTPASTQGAASDVVMTGTTSAALETAVRPTDDSGQQNVDGADADGSGSDSEGEGSEEGEIEEGGNASSENRATQLTQSEAQPVMGLQTETATQLEAPAQIPSMLGLATGQADVEAAQIASQPQGEIPPALPEALGSTNTDEMVIDSATIPTSAPVPTPDHESLPLGVSVETPTIQDPALTKDIDMTIATENIASIETPSLPEGASVLGTESGIESEMLTAAVPIEPTTGTSIDEASIVLPSATLPSSSAVFDAIPRAPPSPVPVSTTSILAQATTENTPPALSLLSAPGGLDRPSETPILPPLDPSVPIVSASITPPFQPDNITEVDASAPTNSSNIDPSVEQPPETAESTSAAHVAPIDQILNDTTTANDDGTKIPTPQPPTEATSTEPQPDSAADAAAAPISALLAPTTDTAIAAAAPTESTDPAVSTAALPHAPAVTDLGIEAVIIPTAEAGPTPAITTTTTAAGGTDAQIITETASEPTVDTDKEREQKKEKEEDVFDLLGGLEKAVDLEAANNGGTGGGGGGGSSA